MLTFLRKIRKSLMDSGSTRKYLFYAIGEVCLVVIGILIALQINKFKRGPGYPRVKYEMYSDPLFVKTVNEMIDTTIRESNLPPENTLDLILFNTTTIAREITRINKQTKEGALRYLENENAV